MQMDKKFSASGGLTPPRAQPGPEPCWNALPQTTITDLRSPWSPYAWQMLDLLTPVTMWSQQLL